MARQQSKQRLRKEPRLTLGSNGQDGGNGEDLREHCLKECGGFKRVVRASVGEDEVEVGTKMRWRLRFQKDTWLLGE